MAGNSSLTKPLLTHTIGSDGALLYLEATGTTLNGEPIYRSVFLDVPGDYAEQAANGTPYVLTPNPITGLPYYAPATLTLVEAFGMGTGLGLGLGRD